jgi:hypothetical protein
MLVPLYPYSYKFDPLAKQAEGRMAKEKILRRLEQTWAAFSDAFAGLSDAQLLEAGVTEDWSVKDILAHVSWWEEEALKHLPGIARGERAPRYSTMYGGIDAFNAQMTELKRGLSLGDVRAQMEDTHRRLIEYLDNAPDELFETGSRFQRRLRLDTYSHYPIHTKAIRLWRDRPGGR